MSRGQSQPRSQSGRRALGRCKSSINTENVLIIDVDVVIPDVPESSHQGSRGLRAPRRNMFPTGAIIIDDEDGDTDSASRIANRDASSKNCPASSHSPLAVELDIDDSTMSFRNGNSPTKSAPKMRMYVAHDSSRNSFGFDLTSESSESKSGSNSTAESDSSDCEIMEDSSGNIRELWERAALRKKLLARDRFVSEDRASASGSSAIPESSSSETIYDQVNIENFINKADLNHFEEMPAEDTPSNLSNEKESLSSSVATADELIEDPFLKRNVNTCVADSDPTIGICHEGPGIKNKEAISDKCRAQSTDETLFDQTRDVFRDLQVPLPGPSLCNSRLRREVRGGVSFVDKDDTVHLETSFCTAELQCETRFQEKEGPCPVNLSSCSSQPWDGRHIFPDSESLADSQLLDERQPNGGSDCLCINEEAALGEPFLNHHAGSETTERSLSSHTQPDNVPKLQKDLIGDRERHKESDEYKRAAEEEWASRLRQLQIQAEEAQRLRKRKKDERRLLDMEKRQKLRLEEIRELQRKDEETIVLKEQLRAEVRKELDKMELRYRDMASLLRGLGIHVDGGPFPLSREVHAAYKQALLRFHPDRASRNDIRQQVEAEEKFKLISRLKEKLMSSV